jgi:hypothetical protein
LFEGEDEVCWSGGTNVPLISRDIKLCAHHPLSEQNWAGALCKSQNTPEVIVLSVSYIAGLGNDPVQGFRT